MSKLLVICGHGAGDCGAVGNGYKEADMVRTLGKKIKENGGNQVEIYDITRNAYRDNYLSKVSPNAYSYVIELHMDSGAQSAHGGHVIIKAGLSADKYDNALVTNVIKKYFTGRSQYIVGRDDLANPNRASARGINYRLIELGFITNAGDVNIFNSNVNNIANDILKSFGICSKSKEGWQKDSTGWWYIKEDGHWCKNQWLCDNGTWYYFNERGYMVHSGWRMIEGYWYYFSPSGAMVHSGWRQIENNWYFFKVDGKACRNEWNLYNGNWSYFDDSCICLMDRWLAHRNHWYYLDSKGYALRGIHDIENETYEFMSETCEMIDGFVDHDGTKYFYNDGSLKTCPHGALVKSQGFIYKNKEYEADLKGRVQ